MAAHYARDAHPTELLQFLREGYRGYDPEQRKMLRDLLAVLLEETALPPPPAPSGWWQDWLAPGVKCGPW
jgi:hypothetical protein